MSDLDHELEELRREFTELERWTAESGELAGLTEWTLNALRKTRPVVDRLCSFEEPVEELPSRPPPPDAHVEFAARVLESVQRFSMAVRDLMQRHVGTLDEATRERLNALAGDVVEQVYLRVLDPTWRRWPELAAPEAE